MNLDKYQTNILETFDKSSNNLAISAVAGSGKTFTLMQAAKLVDDPKSIFIAFNKIIADTGNQKLQDQGSKMTAKTFHSLGYTACRKYISKLGKVDDYKYQDLAKVWLEQRPGLYRFDAQQEVSDCIKKIANNSMLNGLDGTDPELTRDIADTYDIAYDEHIIEAVPWVIQQGNDKDVLAKRGLSFIDMLWLPYYNQWELTKYNVMFTDECLPYDTLVRLSDGTGKRIGDIVKNKLQVEVDCFDVDLKQPKKAKVTGWSKKPMKQLVKIETEKEELICTEDHKILTRGGWLAAGKITKGQYVLTIKNNHPYSRKVLSAKYVISPEKWVYDIEVEGVHNFYANNILVHNCQDYSNLSINLAKRSLAKDGRFLAAGDSRQSIYLFAGSASDSFGKVVDTFGASELPLSFCYRCGKNIVKAAQALVPHIESPDWMHEGLETEMSLGSMLNSAQSGDAILCRVNAPLVGLCLSFLKAGKKATIRGRDIGKAISSHIKKIGKLGDFLDFLRLIEVYRDREVARLHAKVNFNQGQVDYIEDVCDCINALYDPSTQRSVEDLAFRMETLFSDDVQGIVLSTVHKAKGLEFPRVFIVMPHLLPLKRDGQSPEQVQQELNLKYVAITRAMNELVWVKG